MSLVSQKQVRRGAIRIEDAVKIYDPEGAHILAVDHCSFAVAPGEICMLLGPSGCGKTSLLNAIAGFHRLDGGAIYLDDEMLCGPGRRAAAIGPDRIVVFQNGALFPWKTALENVAFGPVVQGRLSKPEAFARARQLMADAGLGGHEDAYPGQISSGLRRRVEIVRALLNDPAVLLLDEPYRALDALTRSVMHEALLDTHARTGVTIIFITHDIEEAVFLGHRVVVMTARPCRPKRIFDIDLPRPRDIGIVASKRFRELTAEIAGTLDAEALKSFARGEKEGHAA